MFIDETSKLLLDAKGLNEEPVNIASFANAIIRDEGNKELFSGGVNFLCAFSSLNYESLQFKTDSGRPIKPIKLKEAQPCEEITNIIKNRLDIENQDFTDLIEASIFANCRGQWRGLEECINAIDANLNKDLKNKLLGDYEKYFQIGDTFQKAYFNSRKFIKEEAEPRKWIFFSSLFKY